MGSALGGCMEQTQLPRVHQHTCGAFTRVRHMVITRKTKLRHERWLLDIQDELLVLNMEEM